MRHCMILGVAVSVGFCVLHSGASAAVTFNWATVGNPGNAADSATGGLYGSVDDTYQISKTEVSNAQYAEFLNAVAATDSHNLYNLNMGTDANGGITRSGTSGSYSYVVKTNQGNQPVIYVSWNDAARFINWLNNGQGSASTESGVYDMTQVNPSRSADARIFIPTENEWYKAAYYDPTLNNGAGGYWNYATKSNISPTSEAPAGGSNSANYKDTTSGFAVTGSVSFYATQDYLTDVGAYADSSSYYGTFDQGGNVYEWDETLISGSYRAVRGGAWGSVGSSDLAAMSRRDTQGPADERANIGFRVARVPEPGSCVLLLTLGAAAMMRRR